MNTFTIACSSKSFVELDDKTVCKAIAERMLSEQLRRHVQSWTLTRYSRPGSVKLTLHTK